MKLLGEKTVPRELFSCITDQNILPTAHLIKMTRVCKNWHALVHAEDIVRQRLTKMGISADLIDAIKTEYSCKNTFDVWVLLSNLQLHFDQESYRSEKDWFRIPSQTKLVNFINEHLQIIQPNFSINFDRIDLTRNLAGCLYFDSVAKFMLFKKNKNDMFTMIRGEYEGATIDNNVLAKAQNFCGNDDLFRQLQHFNSDEFVITNLHNLLSTESGVFIAGLGGSSGSNKIIKHQGNLIFIQETTRSVILSTSLDCDDIETNLREKHIFLISPTGWKMINYHLQVKDDLAPVFLDIFKNAELKLGKFSHSRRVLQIERQEQTDTYLAEIHSKYGKNN